MLTELAEVKCPIIRIHMGTRETWEGVGMSKFLENMTSQVGTRCSHGCVGLAVSLVGAARALLRAR